MTKFSNEDLTRWKKEICPAPIVTKRVRLQRENAEWLGCCPDVFHKKNTGHSDTNPSLKFWKSDDGTWLFKCFSCNASGNLFEFVQAFDKIPFTAAVKKVLEEAGVAGWTEGNVQSDPEMPECTRKEHVTFTMDEYTLAVRALEDSPEAQKWLAGRGIGMETARRFHLGFVPSPASQTIT